MNPYLNRKTTFPQEYNTEREPDAEKQVEEGPAETCREAHPGKPSSGHGHVCHEVTDGVSPCQQREAEDGVGEAESDAEDLQEGDDLVGEGVDPDDGNPESEERKERSP